MYPISSTSLFTANTFESTAAASTSTESGVAIDDNAFAMASPAPATSFTAAVATDDGQAWNDLATNWGDTAVGTQSTAETEAEQNNPITTANAQSSQSSGLLNPAAFADEYFARRDGLPKEVDRLVTETRNIQAVNDYLINFLAEARAKKPEYELALEVMKNSLDNLNTVIELVERQLQAREDLAQELYTLAFSDDPLNPNPELIRQANELGIEIEGLRRDVKAYRKEKLEKEMVATELQFIIDDLGVPLYEFIQQEKTRAQNALGVQADENAGSV
ncbi:MAG: hypothetical protein KC474_11790 [Cyanobacteria bacterium HKST-UBA04]|nr:hypothetical protein [Cyanobacteria bacterium HKST-UBA04]MCA9842670.1 hypothetical protein [Cyanobacteria bacterium HKST-UBA03]